MRDALEFDGVKPAPEAYIACAFRGPRLQSRRLHACSRVRRGDLSHPRRIRSPEDVRLQAWTGYQPRRSVGRLRRSAFRAVRSQRRRAGGEAAAQDRARSQAASPDRHRARRGLPLRRTDAVFVVRAKAFRRCSGLPKSSDDRHGSVPPLAERPTAFGEAGGAKAAMSDRPEPPRLSIVVLPFVKHRRRSGARAFRRRSHGKPDDRSFAHKTSRRNRSQYGVRLQRQSARLKDDRARAKCSLCP